MSKISNGSCICNAVKIKAKAVSQNVGVCHCDTCTKWSGGPLFAVESKGDAIFEGKPNISLYKSSDWAERGFCKICGTHLFYHLLESDGYIFPVGLFDNLKDLVLEHQIFIEQKPEYFSFAQKTKEMTGEEVFAAFGEK